MTESKAPILDQIFAELRSRCDTDGYIHTFYVDDLERWSGLLGLPWFESLNCIGIELAKRYDSGSVNYAFGNSLANELWSEMISRLEEMPEGCWPLQFDEVYSAFDAGEFRRKKDGEADPVKLYTDPMIMDFVASLS
ncbi:MAG: hypothetical protein OSA41_11470 [Erythrobacter sp.]|jgi:hypothetical protein|uniref:hypothetical protein n=1 Tax=Qipengyuania citrea TaxID=225971 RepID=UPI001A51348D|nr:hypothetical protein [Qipengyuania citrea]MBL4717899.1 hypothetical protein [Erythrobacter sp.]MCP2018612.1 hypothetical protein [Qipengyuania citrea]MDE0902321.1 hypothetical protein [Erythrobacter sp.]